VALSNLLLWGHSPIAVDETTGNVSYLLLMTGNSLVTGTGTNVVYTIDENSFNHQAAISTGTNSWPYDCALMTYSNSIKSISFTGFHNEEPSIKIGVTSGLVALCEGQNPTVQLQATRAASLPRSGTFQWVITKGAGRATIVGTDDEANLVVRGTAASDDPGDVEIVLTYEFRDEAGVLKTVVQSKKLTVQRPTGISLASTKYSSSTPNAAGLVSEYTRSYDFQVYDQFKAPIRAIMPVNETVTNRCSTIDIVVEQGSDFTNAKGIFTDDLGLKGIGSHLDCNVRVLNSQIFIIGGCTLDSTGRRCHFLCPKDGVSAGGGICTDPCTFSCLCP